jgi:hypothetical protein
VKNCEGNESEVVCGPDPVGRESEAVCGSDPVGDEAEAEAKLFVFWGPG